MLDLRFFKNPRFTAATTAITLVFFAMFGSYFLFTQYLQFVHGYDPLSAGLRILPWALAYLVSATQWAKLPSHGTSSPGSAGSHAKSYRAPQVWHCRCGCPGSMQHPPITTWSGSG